MQGAFDATSTRDVDHMKLLSIFYFVFAGLNALGGCFGLFYTALGIMFMTNPEMMDTPDAEEAFQRMTPTTIRRRIGKPGSDLFEEWKGHEQLMIDYVASLKASSSSEAGRS